MSRPGSDVQSLDTPLDPELLRAVPLQVLLIPKGKDPVYFFFKDFENGLVLTSKFGSVNLSGWDERVT